MSEQSGTPPPAQGRPGRSGRAESASGGDPGDPGTRAQDPQAAPGSPHDARPSNIAAHDDEHSHGQSPDSAPDNGRASEGPGTDPASRLAPRPIQRPGVDSEQASIFARPEGIRGSFDSTNASDNETDHSRPEQDPPQQTPSHHALSQAFGRPAHGDEVLQRPPGEQQPQPAEADTFWNTRGDRDPWRNPSASAVIGPPAVTDEQEEVSRAPEPGPLLSARELLFGRRVRPRALATLAGVACVLAIIGGFIGRITAEEGNPLTNPDVTLAEAKPGADRPSGAVSQVAQRVVPAVVSVETHVGAQGGTGSGVVIDGNGYVVTNNHVVSMAADTPNARVSTVFHDGTRAPARIVGRDVNTDLAVLKVEVSNPTVVELGNSSNLAVGDDVIAVGSPLGLASTVTTGIVSSVHRPVRLAGEGTDTNAVIDAIQTDAAINPGNSGGALVDGNGAVVGVNSAIRTLGSGGQGGSIGLGFAIPIDDVRRIAEELIRTGQVRHADLGVNAKSVSDGMADGAQVRNVRDGSAAAAAGIAEGDVITRVGERKVSGADELIVAVDRHRVGTTVPVTFVRGGRELVLDVELT